MTDPVSAVAPFGAPFAGAREEDWRRLVDKVLKGAPFDRLISKTADGIALQPLYPRAQDRPLLGRGEAGPWRALARIDHPDAAQAAAQIADDLSQGASGLHLVLAGSIGGYGVGLPAGALRDALAATDLHGVALELDAPATDATAAETLAGLIEAQDIAPQAAQVCFGLSPVAGDGTPTNFAARAMALRARGFHGPFVVADGRPVHAAGGSDAQELAFALALAVAALRGLEAAGADLDDARAMISFRIAADADQFAGIARLRALRLLWARVEQSCGLAPRAARIHAETAWRMTTRRDPWVNVLRATVAAFAAGVGGADAVSVLPYTQALGAPDAFARRLARNTQLVLIEEANLARVSDPAAGAGGFEALTDALAAAAWAQFQALEREGGAVAALRDGRFAQEVARVRAERLASVARRRTPVTGTSEYPDLAEAPQRVLAPCGAIGAFGPFAPMRLAEPFERLRDSSDERLARTGARPRVFLACLGSPAAFAARAMFARGFFEAGGIEAVSGEGFADAHAAADAFKASGAALACLCSSDEVYGEQALACGAALSGAGARRVYLAGRPGEAEAALRGAGIGGFIYAGADAVAALEEATNLAG